jgi:NAD(P)-dependent dehydrogenase (short-subunit alcohol dehydrogenase family)
MVPFYNESKKRMEKKTILITGASGGMGTALTDWFLRGNYHLLLHYFDHVPSTPESENVTHLRADLRDPDQISTMMKEISHRSGGVDILINNAGISRSGMSWKITSDDWDETMSVNLNAPFHLTKAAIPHMRSSKYGRIINISSVVAQTGNVGTAAYAASKAGLIGLTRTLAKELASSGISVNALALGYFETGMISDVPLEQQAQIIQGIPAGRLGSTDTVCKTVEWLLSDEAAYVTGQVINLNGGLHSS